MTGADPGAPGGSAEPGGGVEPGGSVEPMARWVAVVGAELGLDPSEVDVPLLLDVARDVAHQVLRPGAPVTAYLLGLAVGRGADPVEAARRLTELARTWPQRPPR